MCRFQSRCERFDSTASRRKHRTANRCLPNFELCPFHWGFYWKIISGSSERGRYLPIKQHPFFKGINWDCHLDASNTPPPFNQEPLPITSPFPCQTSGSPPSASEQPSSSDGASTHLDKNGEKTLQLLSQSPKQRPPAENKTQIHAGAAKPDRLKDKDSSWPAD